ncbi:MAG: NAD(P)/FAD-dependent oxidoreductase [Dichotomicrobium sp.]
MRTDFDAIAIGGGLAGCAFALRLANRGLRVALIERTAGAKLKVCGDFLSAEAQTCLQALGLDIHRMNAERIHDLRLVAGRRASAAALPFPAAGLSRLTLDEMLLSLAAEAGVQVMRGRPARAPIFTDHGVLVQAGHSWLRARYVALATGKHNLRGLPRAHGTLAAFKMSFHLSAAARHDLAGRVQVAGYPGGYIGACNIEDGAATLCWLAGPAMMRRSRGRWSGQLDEISRRVPLIGDLLSGARPLSEKPAGVAAIPYGYRRRHVICENVFPLGDQLAVIPSFTGDGTSIALASAIAAAEAVLAGQGAEAFQRAFQRRLDAQFRWAVAMDVVFKSAVTRWLGVAAIKGAPGIATRLARVTRLRAHPPVSASKVDDDEIGAEPRAEGHEQMASARSAFDGLVEHEQRARR